MAADVAAYVALYDDSYISFAVSVASIETKMMAELFTCPRRLESPFGVEKENADEYRSKTGCSYCGSIDQDEFFSAIEAGNKLSPTDKSYKVYIHGGEFRKFYFQHLNQVGRDRFIQLYNEGKMNLAHPGYFYVAPFFCSRKNEEGK